MISRQTSEKKKNSANENQSIPYIPKILAKGIFKMGKTIGIYEQNKSQIESLTLEKGVLDEINSYMIYLDVKNELAIDFIVELAKK